MTTLFLWPSIDPLTQEYVLVQAWKKTVSYIRYHNWYSDTLELDRTAVNQPQLLAALAGEFTAASQWVSDPLRIVPAPKSQQWRVAPETKSSIGCISSLTPSASAPSIPAYIPGRQGILARRKDAPRAPLPPRKNNHAAT